MMMANLNYRLLNKILLPFGDEAGCYWEEFACYHVMLLSKAVI
jgi:hypothetical protein